MIFNKFQSIIKKNEKYCPYDEPQIVYVKSWSKYWVHWEEIFILGASE